MALHGATKEEILKYAQSVYKISNKPSVEKIRAHNPYNELCDPCVPQAIQCVVAASDFEDAIRNCISIGGDSDTISAIGGSIAEALYGVPAEIEEAAESFLDETLFDIHPDFKEYVKKYSAK